MEGVVERLQGGDGLGAARLGIYASGMEGAAGWRVERGGRIAREEDAGAGGFTLGIGDGDGADQGAGVGMERMFEDARSGPDFDDPAEIHDGDALGNMFDNREVVGNEDERQAHLAREACEEVDDLRLDRNVQGGNRLVGDQEPGVDRQGAGNGDALPLAAGEFVRIAALGLRRQADFLEQGGDARGEFGGGNFCGRAWLRPAR